MVEVGKDEVTLRLGKQANRRQLQFALQSLVAVFGKYQVKYKLAYRFLLCIHVAYKIKR